MSAVGQLIRAHRTRLGWNQRELSKRAFGDASAGRLRCIDRVEKGLLDGDARIDQLVVALSIPTEEYAAAQGHDEQERAATACRNASQRCDALLTLRVAAGVYMPVAMPQHLSEDELVQRACEQTSNRGFAGHLLLPSGIGVWITREGVVSHRTERRDDGGPGSIHMRYEGRPLSSFE